ncbi:MAG: hypothetical protein ABSB86_07135 [Bryobacteraceae bacterium]|jgi:hypothetical protein
MLTRGLLVFLPFILSPAAELRTSAPAPVAIVVGFMGGFVGPNDKLHAEVQLAKRLSDAYPSTLQVRMFENHRGDQARREILRLLDTDRDGSLSADEKSNARIAIFGHSWGGSETVTVARALGQEGIPILLTVQVDSVQKPGEDDASIPANVSQAINFYQSAGLVHGRSKIRAADASHTRILGNFRLDYKTTPVSCEGYPWFARVFMRPHIEIESDPAVWRQVEGLIRSKLLLNPRSE